MFALLLIVVLAVVVFGVVAAVIGRSRYRWIALASGLFALVMLVAVPIILLGAGVVAIGTSGSLAQVLLVACVAGVAGASVLCAVAGTIAIGKRRTTTII